MKRLFIIIFQNLVIIFGQSFEEDWDQGVFKTNYLSFEVTTFCSGFDIPWGMVFLPSGELLVTDISGTLWQVSKNGDTKIKIKNSPKVRYAGQGGLLDVQIHPDFNTNRFVYLSYSDISKRNRSHTTISRAVLDENSLKNFEVLFRAEEELFTNITRHYGSRIVFDKNGFLYFSIGDRGVRNEAQNISLPNGKIHRIKDNGIIPSDNPFFGQKGALHTIWSFGNRNPQGLAIHPLTGQLWESEHGPRGGDELNIILKGNNYGWPKITYGKNYSGTKITNFTHMDGMEQPELYWTPSIAVCGIQFYKGKKFKPWENNLLATSLKFERLHRVKFLDDGKIEDEIIYSAGSRVRDVEVDNSGFIYVALEDPGRIVKLSPIVD